MKMEIVSAGGKKVNARYRGFTIETDQSKEYGGDGSAPEPFDLFLAAIGTCAAINVIVFCQKRNIPTENITLIQHDEKNPETNMREKITIEIKLPPEFPAKYRKAVIKVAEQCAVTRHIFNPPEFDIQVT